MKKTQLFAAVTSAVTLAALLYRQLELPSLSGRTVLITGGSRGLGLAMAREFGRRGAQLILVARKGAELSGAHADLVRCGISSDAIRTHVCDVTDPEQTATLGTLGAVDILVNNAGVMATGSPVQAYFKGDAQAEYKWFSAAANLPFTSVNASHAARRIVAAALHGTPEITVGLHALLPARLGNLFPSVTAAGLSLANALLPGNPRSPEREQEAEPVQGRLFEGSLPSPVERLNHRNMARFNQ
jgi:NAD(P)-dependent dehydrogenase (short-subunit alcohol dehydrogenase family)